MSLSLTEAVTKDAALLHESLAEEETAAGDRALAHRLAGLPVPPTSIDQTDADRELNDSLLSRLTSLYVSDRNEGDESLDTGLDEGTYLRSHLCAACALFEV